MRGVSRRAMALGGAIAFGLAPAAHAETMWSPAATPSYHPWLAAGLNFAPIALAAAPGAIHSNPVYPGLQTFSLAVAVNPLPGMGQVYAGEPLRGFGILAGGVAMLGATALTNVIFYRGGRSSQADPASSFDPRLYINIGYFTAAGLYSLWAAYDAYQIAERKNAERRSSPSSPAVSTP